MLTKGVRIQLAIFTIVGVIGMATMIFGYMSVPTWMGIAHITVKVELPGTGGLYRFGNVTYRGVQVGRVSSVTPTATGAVAELSLASSPKIPANVEAHVRSVSAVGEQYVDLIPRGGGPPFLADGSVIQRQDTTIPQRVGPMLDQLNALVKSVPKDKVSDLLDETFLAFNGAGYDIQSLLDSGSRIAADANATAAETRTLIDDSAPLLDSQVRTAESLRTWSESLSVVTGQVVTNDPELRKVLTTGPDTADEAARLLDQLKPTLPVLLANMTTVGEIGVTYNPSLRQLLVLLPPYVAGFASMSSMNNPTGMSLGAFSLMMADPPVCTVGFLPPSQWRSPADETTIDTPDNLYCKLPQDSPIAVRGVRNNPCMGRPGKRAPSVEICNSDQEFKPLALRQHALGPYPIDPNLIAQGIPPDRRANPAEQIYAPVQGTPLPSGAVPSGTPPAGPPTPGSRNVPPVWPPPPPPTAVAQYDPRTGRYVGSDGQVYEQSDLAARPGPTDWRQMLPVG
jgi:virulence factor Mce-like protein